MVKVVVEELQAPLIDTEPRRVYPTTIVAELHFIMKWILPAYILAIVATVGLLVLNGFGIWGFTLSDEAEVALAGVFLGEAAGPVVALIVVWGKIKLDA